MPDFWEFPTVSMGLGALNAIYQARFNRYLQHRELVDTSGSRVWAFIGDGEMDEPEAQGALTVAGRERLDNLVFVVNCNLQRLDGPVRGNGKIIQEMEALFRGAGWNVVKVVWGRRWDDLLARDETGELVAKLNAIPDGQLQTLAAEGADYVREKLFDTKGLRRFIDGMDDAELIALAIDRGGHDLRKVHAAYRAAVDHQGQPTVILAQTIKGRGLGREFESRNATHQMKKFVRGTLNTFRDRLGIDVSDEDLEKGYPPYYRPPEDSDLHQYLLSAGAAWAGRCRPGSTAPGRSTCPKGSCTPSSRRARASRRSPPPWPWSAWSGTCCATRTWAGGSCPSSPTRPAPSAWTRSSPTSRSTPPRG